MLYDRYNELDDHMNTVNGANCRYDYTQELSKRKVFQNISSFISFLEKMYSEI